MFRAKVYVESVREYSQAPGYPSSQKEVIFKPVSASDVAEDQHFSKWTPNGELKLSINNPLVLDQIQPGKLFYVDFTDVPLPAGDGRASFKG